ncbi:MAG: CHAT domain-containing protein [Prevotella sp.]|nr:CHAT domain-containing protein [Prevotella sp.]
MFRKFFLTIQLVLYSAVGFAQESQTDYISIANLKFKQIDQLIANGDINTVCELQNEVLLFVDKIEDSEMRFLIYDVAIDKYIKAQCYKDAITLSIRALDKAREYYGSKHKDVAELLYLLGFSYAHDGQVKRAIEFGKQSVQMYEDLKEIESESYLMAIIMLNQYYGVNHQYPESIDMLRKSLKFMDLDKVPSERLAIVFRAIAANYSDLNNFTMAQIYTIKALHLYKDKMSASYLTLKQNLAWLYSNNGNHKEAIQTISEVCDTMSLSGDNYTYALALCDKASIYIHTNDTIRQFEAIQIAEQSAKCFESANDTLSNEYVHSLMTKANAYRSLDLYERAQEIHKRVYNLQKSFLDPTNINDLEILSYSAVLANDLQGGLSYFLMLKNMVMQEKGEYSADYAHIEYQLSILYYLLHDYESAITNIMDALPVIRNSLAKSFFKLEDKERAEFWNKYSSIFGESLPRMCYAVANPKYSGLMFDAALLSKGILLNTERLKRNLMLGNAQVDAFVKPFFLNWRDIESKLKEDDIAIEFVRVNLYPNIPVYIAVAIRRGYKMPHITKLFFEDELKQVSDTVYYQCGEMADLVWKPLLSEFEGVKNIYFSPSGALYNIGIEYLPGMENYNIYRLSSTRELITDRKTELDNRAVLYGGLDYYAEFNAIPTKMKSEIGEDIYIDHADVRNMKLRGGKDPLPQTKVEVEQIGKVLKNAQWNYDLITGEDGTEESFKSLSGKKIKTLHLSTHGFYYTPEEADSIGYDFLQIDNRIASAEDKALTRSGLIMSGANHILEGEELPKNVEDGILTAKEIADVDLRGLDLVVLSACQTGLGDIAQGEGVFGLQRGFKKAGANSILMSLWEVDDKATQILMTQFYKNLLSGQSKRQSLLAAQEYLRKVEDGKYDEPKYWAAFILLDGIQ